MSSDSLKVKKQNFFFFGKASVMIHKRRLKHSPVNLQKKNILLVAGYSLFRV